MSGERRNNPAEMSISEQIESIKAEICDKYCKWPEEIKKGITVTDNPVSAEEDEAAAMDWTCSHCPLTRL